MKKRIAFCTGGIAALCAVPIPANAVPVDCWWGDPRVENGKLEPTDCDITKRVVDQKKYLDVSIPKLRKQFTMRLLYAKDSDNYGTAYIIYKGNKLPAFWQIDDENDVTVGLKGYETHFAFDPQQFISGGKSTPAIRNAFFETPARLY